MKQELRPGLFRLCRRAPTATVVPNARPTVRSRTTVSQSSTFRLARFATSVGWEARPLSAVPPGARSDRGSKRATYSQDRRSLLDYSVGKGQINTIAVGARTGPKTRRGEQRPYASMMTAARVK